MENCYFLNIQELKLDLNFRLIPNSFRYRGGKRKKGNKKGKFSPFLFYFLFSLFFENIKKTQEKRKRKRENELKVQAMKFCAKSLHRP